MAKRLRKSARSSDTDRVIDEVMELVLVEGWVRLTMSRIAQTTGISLAELYALFPSKNAVLAAFFKRIDAVMAQALDPDADTEASARDRLFEVVMAHFDALLPYKESVRRIVGEARFDPVGLVCAAPVFRCSISWMLECAGLSTGGLRGAIRLEGLAAIYAYTFSVWLRDDSEDMTKTMAALDRRLAHAEQILRRVCTFGNHRPEPGVESAS